MLFIVKNLRLLFPGQLHDPFNQVRLFLRDWERMKRLPFIWWKCPLLNICNAWYLSVTIALNSCRHNSACTLCLPLQNV